MPGYIHDVSVQRVLWGISRWERQSFQAYEILSGDEASAKLAEEHEGEELTPAELAVRLLSEFTRVGDQNVWYRPTPSA